MHSALLRHREIAERASERLLIERLVELDFAARRGRGGAGEGPRADRRFPRSDLRQVALHLPVMSYPPPRTRPVDSYRTSAIDHRVDHRAPADDGERQRIGVSLCAVPSRIIEQRARARERERLTSMAGKIPA